MALYPTTILDATVATADQNTIPSGSLVVIPLDMTVSQMVQFNIWQMSLTQDFSLRAWISDYENGVAFSPGDYPILRYGALQTVVYVATQTPPADTFAVLVQPGRYFINLLNLTNADNIFGFEQTVLA